MRERFLIVDGNSLLYRSFHALPVMDNGEGLYTNALHGFLNMLLKAIKEENVSHLAVCFDEHGPTFRHTVYADYKAGRSETPPELVQQLQTIRHLLTDMGIRYFALSGWEADDLLGTLSRLGLESGLSPLLLTGDRDALQLVGGGTELLFTRKGISETIRFTPETVYETYGFMPEQVTDWKGLAGDSSDNIPGVPGVGDKTAVKLLKQFGTLENVLANTCEVKGKLREKLETYADQARMCRELATIRRDAPITFRAADCRLPDLKKAVPHLEKLKLQSIIRRISAGDHEQTAPVEILADIPREMLPFAEMTAAQDKQELERWIQSVPASARPLAVYLDDAGATLAAGNGAACSAVIGGDLLTPGLNPAEILSVLSEEMQAHPAVVHDGKRLMHLMDKYTLPLPEKFAWDAMLGAYLLNPQEKSYALPALCGDFPADARGLMSLSRYQEKCIAAQGMTHLMQDVEMPLAMTLFRMEKTGFRVDTDFLRQLGQKYEGEIEEMRRQVVKACGKTFNLNSPVQLGEVLFEHLQLPHGKKTSRGYSTSAEVLENLRDIAPEVIEPLLRYRQLTKLNSTYVEGLLRLTDSSGRVHSFFDQVATATGRISSSEPNLQNIPVRTEEGREIRRAFLPQEGWVLLDADYSQIELRLMAHFSGDHALVEAFRTGQDVHTRTASEIFDVPLDKVDSTLRSRAKAVNFGLIYGISGFGLARNTGVSPAEAREFIARYFLRYPGVKTFMDEAAADGVKNGYALTLMGRRRYLPELKSEKSMVREFGKRAAMNTPVQGTAADIIKLAMVRVDEALRREKMNSRLILQVHDELLLECPEDEAARAAELLKSSMEEVIALSVPLLAQVQKGESWAQAK